jgi:hypothetical protein
MNFKYILLSFFLVILFAFNSINKPFADINFGKISKDDFINKMIENGNFKIYKEDKEYPNDTSAIIFTLKHIDKEFPMRVYLNEQYSKGKRYNFGSLRRFEMRIGENIVEEDNVKRCYGKISKGFVDNLYKTYCSIYGNPDSVTNNHKLKNIGFAEFFESSSKDNSNNIDKSFISGKTAVWNEENCIIKFYIPPHKKPLNPKEKVFYQKNNDESIYISYEMYDYESELKRLKDSIASNFNPNDLLKFKNVSYSFENTKNIQMKYSGVEIKDLMKIDFITEFINGFKYDVYIYDSYGEIIYLDKDKYYELDRKLGNDGHGVITYEEIYPFNKTMNFYLVNDIPAYKKDKLKIDIVINQINLDDGRVIKMGKY